MRARVDTPTGIDQFGIVRVRSSNLRSRTLITGSLNYGAGGSTPFTTGVLALVVGLSSVLGLSLASGLGFASSAGFGLNGGSFGADSAGLGAASALGFASSAGFGLGGESFGAASDGLELASLGGAVVFTFSGIFTFSG